MTAFKVIGPALIWGLSINALSRWAGDYCWWWCPFTVEAFTDLSFWSAVASMTIFGVAIFAVDGVVWLVRRWTR